MMRRGVGVIAVVCGGLVGCWPGSADTGKSAPPAAATRVTPPEYPIPAAPPRVQAGVPAASRNGLAVEVPAAALVGGKLQVFVRVSVVVPDREVVFRSWREGTWVRLADDLGTIYKPSPPVTPADALADTVRTRFGAAVAFGSGPVRLDRPRVDVLVYDPPSATAAHLDLDLDGRDLGSEHPFLFRIPRAMWQPAPTRPVTSTRRN